MGRLSQVVAGLKTRGSLVHFGINSSILHAPMAAIMANCWKIGGSRSHSGADTLIILSRLSDKRLNIEGLFSHWWSSDQVETAVWRLMDRSLPIGMCVVNL